MDKPDLFTGKVAIVTGGGTGIGRQIAITMVGLGATVVIAGRRNEVLAQAAAEIDPSGKRCIPISTDIRVPEEVDKLADTVKERFGHIDFLVNNAGGQFPLPTLDITSNGWQSVVNLNLNGTFYCSKAIGRIMIEQRSGRIVNITAAFASRGTPGLAHSAAARAGVHSLTETLALEWGQYNITVNSVAPGMVITDAALAEMISYKGEEFLEKLRADVPLNRHADIQEIADAVVYLLSPSGSYITGHIIYLDGGNRLGKGISYLNN